MRHVARTWSCEQILNLAGVFIRVLNLVMLILLLGHWFAIRACFLMCIR